MVVLAVPLASTVTLFMSPACGPSGCCMPCFLLAGLKWPPALVNGASHFGTAWKCTACSPGGRPFTSRLIDTPPPVAGEIVAVPTELPLASFRSTCFICAVAVPPASSTATADIEKMRFINSPEPSMIAQTREFLFILSLRFVLDREILCSMDTSGTPGIQERRRRRRACGQVDPRPAATRHITIDHVIYIGRQPNQLDDVAASLVRANDGYTEYPEPSRAYWQMVVAPALKQMSLKAWQRDTGKSAVILNDAAWAATATRETPSRADCLRAKTRHSAVIRSAATDSEFAQIRAQSSRRSITRK